MEVLSHQHEVARVYFTLDSGLTVARRARPQVLDVVSDLADALGSILLVLYGCSFPDDVDLYKSPR